MVGEDEQEEKEKASTKRFGRNRRRGKMNNVTTKKQTKAEEGASLSLKEENEERNILEKRK